MTFYKMDREGKLTIKDENVTKKQKVVTLQVKFESNVNGVMEEIIGSAVTQGFLDMQSRNLVKATLSM